MEQNTHSMSEAETASSNNGGSPVIRQFEELEAWEHKVNLNVRGGLYHVGRSDQRDAYRLYDDDDHSLAGVLTRKSSPDAERDGKLLFVEPTGDGETTTTVIYSLGVASADRARILDEHLTAIRSQLTGVDFSVDNPQPSYGDQMDGVVALETYYNDVYDGRDLAVEVNDLALPEVEKALFGYNNDVSSTLDLIDMGVNDRRDTNTSPIAVCELLLSYYVDQIPATAE